MNVTMNSARRGENGRITVRWLVLAAASATAALMLTSTSAVSGAIPSLGMVCTEDATAGSASFDLEVSEGRISTPDGNSLYMWSYKPVGGAFQSPGPTLCVTEGDVVSITLTNPVGVTGNGGVPDEAVSIIFPGQSGVTAAATAAPTSPGLLTLEAAPGGSVTYSFTATEPGTYLYQSGTRQYRQVQMGLYGALIVRPNELGGFGPNFAYNDAATEFNPGREYLLLITEIDPNLHQAAELGLPYDVTTLHDRYWTINGRSFPDTIAPNGAPWLPTQPYGSLVLVEPSTGALGVNPLPALVRYGNAGMVPHPYHVHGNNLNIIGNDGRFLDGASFGNNTTMVAPGQTYDLLAQWFNVEDWSSAGPQVPVVIPGLQNLVFKDDVTTYSGSPYLGEQDNLPVGVTSWNACGEFYFPWHSHALNEFQNFDEGFGGLATLWRIDPPGGCAGGG